MRCVFVQRLLHINSLSSTRTSALALAETCDINLPWYTFAPNPPPDSGADPCFVSNMQPLRSSMDLMRGGDVLCVMRPPPPPPRNAIRQSSQRRNCRHCHCHKGQTVASMHHATCRRKVTCAGVFVEVMRGLSGVTIATTTPTRVHALQRVCVVFCNQVPPRLLTWPDAVAVAVACCACVKCVVVLWVCCAPL